MDQFSLYFVEGTLENKLDNIYDGVLEPLSIREVIELRSGFPGPARSIKGSLSAGSEDIKSSSSQILQIDIFEHRFGYSHFNDMLEANISRNKMQNFDDSKSEELSQIDGYVTKNQKSASAGWDYGNLTGVDSIAFGGTGY